MKRLAILMAIACLALPVTAGAQGREHRDHGGGRGESHERGGGDERRGGDRGGYRDERGYRGGPGYGDAGPRGDYYGPRGGPPRSYRFVRGQMLPPEYRGYVVGDYERYHLRRPPRGYYWYRAGDDFVLAALASGLIFEVISAEGY